MRKLVTFVIILVSVLLINNAVAGNDIVGTWQGNLVSAPGNELAIQFKITKNHDGSYSVVLNSPDQGAIKNIKASSVVYKSGRLKLDVAELSGSYEGVLKDGKIEGNWKQEGTSIPLNLEPYKKPVLTSEDMEKLKGQWHGELKLPTNTLTLVFRFEMIKGTDKFAGFLDLPDSGAKGIPVTDMELSDGDLSLKVPSARLGYRGKFAVNKIVGNITLGGGQSFPVTLEKGEYKAPTFSLNIPKETMKLLKGQWNGQLKLPGGLIHVAFRFKTTKKGKFVGFYDVPDRNVKGIPITKADFSDGKLAFTVTNAEYKGQIKGNEFTGEIIQAEGNTPPVHFTLKKGKYIPPSYSLNLPKKTIKTLAGKWKGKLGNINLVLRFEKNKKGEFLGFIDFTLEKDVRITEASLNGKNLKLKVKFLNAEINGELSKDSLDGEWIQSGQNRPLTLRKE